MNDNDNIESVLREDRVFPPPAGFSESIGGAWIASMADYEAAYRRSIEDPDDFWGEAAREHRWIKPFTRVLEWNCPDARWFADGTLNLCDNCVDRHVDEGHGDETAIIWEGEPVGSDGPETLRISYRDLQRETAKFGNALKALGVGKGDIVTIYMPHGARGGDRDARLRPDRRCALGDLRRLQRQRDRGPGRTTRTAGVITADGGWRRGKVVPLKANVDEACANSRRRARRRARALRQRRRAGRRARPTGATSSIDAVRRTALPSRWTRGPAVPPLHLRLDRQAQGDRAHHRRLPARTHSPPSTSFDLPRRATSTGAPPTSAGSPATATSSTDRSRTASTC